MELQSIIQPCTAGHIQAAEAKVAAQNGQTSYGGVAVGSSAAGNHAPANTAVQSTYFGQ